MNTPASQSYVHRSYQIKSVFLLLIGLSLILFSTISIAAPAITAPASGSTLEGAEQTLNWSYDVNESWSFWVYAGSTQGGRQYFDSGAIADESSVLMTGLPTSGDTLYVRFWYRQPGVTGWLHQDIEYQAATAVSLVSPIPDSTLGGIEVTFNWTVNDSGAMYEYWVYLGSSTKWTLAGSQPMYPALSIT